MKPNLFLRMAAALAAAALASCCTSGTCRLKPVASAPGCKIDTATGIVSGGPEFRRYNSRPVEFDGKRYWRFETPNGIKYVNYF